MKKVFVTVFLAALCGCATTSEPSFATKVDPYTKEQQFRLGDIYPANCPGDNRYYGEVELSILGGGEVNALSIEYVGPSWYFLDAKLGLEMLIDGAPFTMKGIPGSSTDVQNGGVRERVYFKIDKTIATRLSNASAIQFRVNGKKGSIEKCMSKSEISEIKKTIPYLPN